MVLFAEAKRINPFPFRELPDKQEVCPCRGISRRLSRPYLYTQNMYKYALLRKHYSGYRRKKIKDEKNELFQHQMYHKNLSENLR